MSSNADAPATRADLESIEAGIRADLGAVETRLDRKIDRIAVELVKTQSDVRSIREAMETKMATKDDVSRILAAIDAFAQKGESYDRKAVSHGGILVDHTESLKDHERRLRVIEAKP